MEVVYQMSELVDKLRARDTTALKEAMSLFGSQLLRVAYVYLKDQDMAKDVVQAVFIKLYYQIDLFNQQASLYTWLYRITVNECKMRLRSWSFRKIRFTDELVEPQLEYSGDLSNRLVESEDKGEIMQMILQLDVKYRMAILFFYYQGLSIKEIAEIMKAREGTVKTWLHRGRKILKDQIESKGGDYYELR